MLAKFLSVGFICKVIKVATIFIISLISYILLSLAFKIEYLSDVKEKLAAKFLKKGKSND